MGAPWRDHGNVGLSLGFGVLGFWGFVFGLKSSNLLVNMLWDLNVVGFW